MRAALLAVLLAACSASSTAGAAVPGSPSPSLSGSLTAPSCARTVARDASGVITTNGRFGILGDTFAGSAQVNDSFVLVMRGATLGQQISLVFVNAGSRAPASTVSYGVVAERMPNAWSDVAFKFWVKPIGFPNTCWQLRTDAGDTGLVLEIGA